MKKQWTWFVIVTGMCVLGVIGTAWYTFDVYTVLHATQPSISPSVETIKTVIMLFGGVGVIMSTHLNIINLLKSQENLSDRTRFDIIENTYKLIERWDNPALLEARKFSRDLANEHNSLSNNDLIKKIEESPKLVESLVLLTNFFEGVRVSITHGRVDKSVVEDSFYRTFNDIFERYKPYIIKKLPNTMKELDALKQLLNEPGKKRNVQSVPE